ncbi:MAG: serine/threonine protein kinase [Alphaproteobacteria bacterium]|nr:serine/threonine protein kinase [Alphaproteobacteria bacterium]
MLEPGQQIDRYLVEDVLGEGGMAVVYRVRHATLGSPHALKLLTVVGTSVQSRLLQEGRVQAGLRHENIVAVHDVVEVAGRPGLVMEWIDGPDMEAWLQAERPTVDQALAVFDGVLRGVGRAHAAGLVHRDLKPGNVLLARTDRGLLPKVADFGLAKALAAPDSADHRTRTGATMGTPGYMAPEQVRNAADVDQRADIWALGCILYRMVIGRPPFVARDTIELLNAICDARYSRPRDLRPELPDAVADAIEGCLVPERDDRIPDCATLAAVLSGEQPWRVEPRDSVTMVGWTEGEGGGEATQDGMAPSFGTLAPAGGSAGGGDRASNAPSEASAAPAPPSVASLAPQSWSKPPGPPPRERRRRVSPVGIVLLGIALAGLVSAGLFFLLVLGIAAFQASDVDSGMPVFAGARAGAAWHWSGDAAAVALQDTAGGTWQHGRVPAGPYTIVASWDGRSWGPAGAITLADGDVAAVVCSRSTGRCR